MAGFVDDATLQDYVHDVLARAPSAVLAPNWASIITQANQRAYYWILQYFLRKGYSEAQVLTWDLGATYQQDIALCLALAIPGFLQEGFNAASLGIADPRKELTDNPMALIAGGVIVDPDGTHGQVTTGPIDWTNRGPPWFGEDA